MGAVEDSTLNLVYNLADLVNKIALLGHLGLRKEQHPGGEGGSPPIVSQLGRVHTVPLPRTYVSRMPVQEILRLCRQSHSLVGCRSARPLHLLCKHCYEN